MLNKIEAHGITGDILRWIGEWLKDREQRVVLNGIMSAWIYVVSGVPQGSILGPLLFLIFINDIDKNIVNKLLKFADDTKLCGKVSSDSDADQMQADLRQLFDWSIDWQMLFNVDKCKIVHFGYKNNRNFYYLGSNVIKSDIEEKDLGVIVHESLKSTSQCVAAAKSANITLDMIRRTFIDNNCKTFLQLYQSLSGQN